jgi:putative FmdB family regulatory protein
LPTYQYLCTECSHAFEQFQSFTDDALTVCPACGGRLRKVFNAVGVVFKGSGFYRTDSRGNGTSPSATEGSSSDSPAAAASSSSSSSSSSGTSDGSSGSSSSGSGSGSSGSQTSTKTGSGAAS